MFEDVTGSTFVFHDVKAKASIALKPVAPWDIGTDFILYTRGLTNGRCRRRRRRFNEQ